MNTGRYIPGVCNIGLAEIRLRKRLGWWGLLIMIVLWILLVGLNVPVWWRLVLIIPAFFSAKGFLQGFMHFCAGFGMRGLFNFKPQVGQTDMVEQAESRTKDHKKAWEIFSYAIMIAIIIAIMAILI